MCAELALLISGSIWPLYIKQKILEQGAGKNLTSVSLRPYERRVLLGLFERTCLFDTNIQFTPQRFPGSFFLLFFFWS
jgi:hypothetical protein